jgi:hypothetical protein
MLGLLKLYSDLLPNKIKTAIIGILRSGKTGLGLTNCNNGYCYTFLIQNMHMLAYGAGD